MPVIILFLYKTACYYALPIFMGGRRPGAYIFSSPCWFIFTVLFLAAFFLQVAKYGQFDVRVSLLR